MKITKTSPITGIDHTMELPITAEQYNRWLDGDLVQDVFNNLTDSEREFLISGITDEEWKQYIDVSDEDLDEEGSYSEPLILTSYYEVRFKDIDPDTGDISQDKRVAICENEIDCNVITQALSTHQDNDDPNRTFYSVYKSIHQ